MSKIFFLSRLKWVLEDLTHFSYRNNFTDAFTKPRLFWSTQHGPIELRRTLTQKRSEASATFLSLYSCQIEVDWMTLCNKGKWKSGIFRKVKASFVNWPLIIDNGRQNRQVVKLFETNFIKPIVMSPVKFEVRWLHPILPNYPKNYWEFFEGSHWSN